VVFAHWADLELSGPIWTKKRELLCAAPSACHLPTHHSNTPLCVLPLSPFSLFAHVKNVYRAVVLQGLRNFAGFCRFLHATTPCKETSHFHNVFKIIRANSCRFVSSRLPVFHKFSRVDRPKSKIANRKCLLTHHSAVPTDGMYFIPDL
jgi:hypothetical protein